MTNTNAAMTIDHQDYHDGQEIHYYNWNHHESHKQRHDGHDHLENIEKFGTEGGRYLRTY